MTDRPIIERDGITYLYAEDAWHAIKDFYDAILNDTEVVIVDPVDCGCCGGLNEFCVHCTDHGGPCPVDGCPIDPSISN